MNNKDTYNDYLILLILYESKLKDDNFHQLIINKIPNIINNQRTIFIYGKQIDVQETFFIIS